MSEAEAHEDGQGPATNAGQPPAPPVPAKKRGRRPKQPKAPPTAADGVTTALWIVLTSARAKGVDLGVSEERALLALERAKPGSIAAFDTLHAPPAAKKGIDAERRRNATRDGGGSV